MRRERLKAAMDLHLRAGRQLTLLTLTVPHDKSDSLEMVLDQLLGGHRRLLNAGRTGVELRESLGIVGSERILEVTHGANGWHPHLHLVLAHDRPVNDLGRLQQRIQESWKRVLALGGLVAAARGADLRMVTDPAGLAHYLTKPPLGRAGLTGVFRVLAHRLECHANSCATCRRSLWIWREYVDAMRARRRFASSGARLPAVREAGTAEDDGSGDPCLARPQRQFLSPSALRGRSSGVGPTLGAVGVDVWAPVGGSSWARPRAPPGTPRGRLETVLRCPQGVPGGRGLSKSCVCHLSTWGGRVLLRGKSITTN